jgi:hypothetical protein
VYWEVLQKKPACGKHWDLSLHPLDGALKLSHKLCAVVPHLGCDASKIVFGIRAVLVTQPNHLETYMTVDNLKDKAIDCGGDCYTGSVDLESSSGRRCW